MRAISKAAVHLAIAAAMLCSPGAAMSQSSSLGCKIEQVAGGERHVLRCQNGVTIIAEKATRYSLLDRDGDQIADGVRLRRKGLLIEVARRLSGSAGFVVVTPQAIAAVRGTKWAVDVPGASTSVFVVNGTVTVQKPASGERVNLRAGQGVDVERGVGQLVVKRWPVARVSALLARFGQ